MITRKRLIAFQVLLFIFITFNAGIFAYYFPNMPPFLRNLAKARIRGKFLAKNDLKINDSRFLNWFNRDPERNIPQISNVIVAPADGFVWNNKFFKDKNGMKHIVIEMRYTDVHVQRVPIDGRVLSIEGDGKALPADALLEEYMYDKMLPYQKVTSLQTEIGLIRVRQITSMFAKRIEVYLKEDQKVQRGERLGRVLAGSTVVIELPEFVKILVQPNQDVVAGETIIAQYELLDKRALGDK